MQTRVVTVEDETEGNYGSGSSSSISSLMWLNCKFNANLESSCVMKGSLFLRSDMDKRKPELIDAPSAMKWLHSNKEIAGKRSAFLLQTRVQRVSERRRTMQALLGCQADRCWCAGSFALFLSGCMCKIYYRWCTDSICKNGKINTSVAHKEPHSFREQTRLWFNDLMNSQETQTLSKPTFCHWLTNLHAVALLS